MVVTMRKVFKDATVTSTGQGADSEGGCFGQWVTLSVLNQEGQGRSGDPKRGRGVQNRWERVETLSSGMSRYAPKPCWLPRSPHLMNTYSLGTVHGKAVTTLTGLSGHFPCDQCVQTKQQSCAWGVCQRCIQHHLWQVCSTSSTTIS